jgi:hypothetical protein
VRDTRDVIDRVSSSHHFTQWGSYWLLDLMDGKPSRTNLHDESSDIDDAQGVPQGPLLTLTIQMGSLALKLASDMLRLAYTLLKPLIPQIVPVALLCLVTPILIFFSLSAGFVVWKTSAVSWVEPVYLQYG